MFKNYTTNYSLKNLGEVITLNGWVAKIRNLGGVIFIDLRDREGIIQLVIRPEDDCYEIANTLKNEYVIGITGKILKRENKNPNLKTGDIEVSVEKLEVLNTCLELPFTIDDNTNALEDTRLKYRYLDMRRNKLKNN